MKDHPILFSTEMVRAILNGAKCVTRRVIRPQPLAGYRLWYGIVDGHQAWTDHPMQGEKGNIFEVKVPYLPGDRLWVRESLIRCQDSEGSTPLALYSAGRAQVYRDGGLAEWQWKPSVLAGMYMPRWAIRITLEVKSVRVERLQDISDVDCCREMGCPVEWSGPGPEPYKRDLRGCFKILWDKLNARRGFSWQSNPWIWGYEFVRLE